MAENTEEQEAQVAEDAPEQSTVADGASDRGADGDMSVDTLREMLAEARKEAAKYRVRAREAEQQVSEMVSPDAVEAERRRAQELEVELSKVRLGAEFQLPTDIAARIQGDTQEEREQDAKRLADLIRKAAASEIRVGRGGVDPSAEATPTDPAALASRIRRRPA